MNEQRLKEGRPPLTVVIRDGVKIFMLHDRVCEKFNHAPEFGVKIPDSVYLNYAETLSLKDKKQYFKQNVPAESVKEMADQMRKMMMHPESTVERGVTFGSKLKSQGNAGSTTQVTAIKLPEWRDSYSGKIRKKLVITLENGNVFFDGMKLSRKNWERLENDKKLL